MGIPLARKLKDFITFRLHPLEDYKIVSQACGVERNHDELLTLRVTESEIFIEERSVEMKIFLFACVNSFSLIT